MGNIEKRGPNTWRIGVQTSVAQGREWIRDTIKYPPTMTEAAQKRAAKAALKVLEVGVNDGTIVPAKPYTVKELAEKWMTQHVIPNLAPTTARTYQNILDVHILPELGDLTYKQLTPIRLTEFTKTQKEMKRILPSLPEDQLKVGRRPVDMERRTVDPDKPISPRTVRHIYDVLNYLLNKCVFWEIIPKNPLEHVDRPKVRKKKPKALTDIRAMELLRCLQHEHLTFRTAVLLALLGSHRLGEVGGFYWPDVNWDRNTITVEQALHYTPELGNYMDLPKTDAGLRENELPPGMMDLLRVLKEYQDECEATLGDRWRGDGRIICNWDGSPMHHDTPSKHFRKFADLNGFPDITFHKLRGIHASLLFANNIDALAVAARMGHADPATTLRNYGAPYRIRDKQAANVMQAMLIRSGAALTPAGVSDAITTSAQASLSADAPAPGPAGSSQAPGTSGSSSGNNQAPTAE